MISTRNPTDRWSCFKTKTVGLMLLQWVLTAVLIIGPAGGKAWAADEISRLVLSKNSLSLSVGDTYSLTATAVFVSGTTSDATIKADWNSGDASVATVYAGTVAAKAEGTAIITATYMGKTEVVNVTVSKKVKSLSKDKTSLSLRVGSSEQIALTATYTDGTVEQVSDKAEWASGSPEVADVVNGKVTAVGSGETDITATYGGKTVSVPVSVDIVRRLDPSAGTLNLRIGASQKLELIGMFEDGTTEDVADKAQWSSDREDVADAFKGTVTAYGAGQATLTARYGGKTATVIVNVETVRKLEADTTDLFIKPDETAQIKLTATYDDQSTKDVTADAEWSSSDETIVEVEGGLIVANTIGQATVTARYGNKTVTIAVDAGVARKLEADKADLILRKNGTASVKLTATYADGTTEDVTRKADWFSDNEDVAYASGGTIRALGKGEAVVTAQYGDKSVTIPVHVDPAQSLKVDESKLELKIGETKTVALTVEYEDGSTEDVTDQASWSTDNENVASVSKGTITAHGTGQAVITAEYGDKTATVNVQVEIAKKLETDKSDLFLRVGDREQLKLTATYADGSTADVTDKAEWSSDNSDVADVQGGNIVAYKSGQATIKATYGSKTANVTVDVSVARKLEADKKSLSLRKGDTASVKLTATYADGTTEDVTGEAQWSSDDEDIAIVSGGTVRALDSGETRLTAKFGEKAVAIAVEVDPAVKLEADRTKIDMQPGDSVQVTLTATFADGTTGDVTDKAEWTTSNDSFVIVEDGYITAVDRGEATITGKYGKRTVKITVSVGALDVLTVSAKTIVLKEGESKPLTVTAKYKDGTVKDVTDDAEWTSSRTASAEVHGGIVTGIASGKATITAKFGEKSVSAVAEVEVANQLTASHRSLILKKGDSAAVTLTATYSDGTTEDVSSKAVWSVSSSKVAEVQDGVVTAIERGKTTLTAKYGSKSVSIPVEVDYAVKLTASDKSIQLKSGQTKTLTVTATFSDGSTRDVTSEVDWSTRNYKVAEVDASGQVTGESYGKTSIVGKFGSKSVTVVVEVDSLKYLKSSVKTIDLKVGDSMTVPLTAYYKDGTTGDVAAAAEWKTSKDAVADVIDGVITAYGKGSATITAKFAGKTVTVRVNVK